MEPIWHYEEKEREILIDASDIQAIVTQYRPREVMFEGTVLTGGEETFGGVFGMTTAAGRCCVSAQNQPILVSNIIFAGNTYQKRD
jgi:hypothetical protein